MKRYIDSGETKQHNKTALCLLVSSLCIISFTIVVFQFVLLDSEITNLGSYQIFNHYSNA